MSVVEWAENFRKLSPESSRGGRFVMAKREIARGPMLAATEPGVRKLTACVSTQLFKTTLMECIIGRFIHLDPCPILVVYPDEDACAMFMTERLEPMIRDTDKLRSIFAGRSRDKTNNKHTKLFPGGAINMASARSKMDLAARPVRIILFDEMGKYVASVQGEGNPVMVAEERQAEFKDNCLSVCVGSPTIAGHCLIEASYLESDQRKAFVACQHCDSWQVLEWESVEIDKSPMGRLLPETARLRCVDCGLDWSEADRRTSLLSIRWRQTKVFDCCGVRQTPEVWDREGRALCLHCASRAVSNAHAGFTASKLYAPNQTIPETAAKFDAANRAGPESLKVFVNTSLARTWKESAEAREWQSVYNKRDRYRSGDVPKHGLILFGGVDCQKDRLEASVWAFGRNRQRYFIEHKVIPGAVYDTATWAALRKHMAETWTHELGQEMSVRDWGIDSGAFTPEVYEFVRSMAGLGNVHAIDGRDDYAGAFIGVGNKEVDKNNKRVRNGMKTLKVGVSYCKQELLGAFALEKPGLGEEFPPGFVHLPDDISEDAVKQLTSEELQTVIERGRSRREWKVIPGRRNEVLDCANYARGLASMRSWERWKEKHFRALEEALGIESGSFAVRIDAPSAERDERPPETLTQRAIKTVRKRRVTHSRFVGR